MVCDASPPLLINAELTAPDLCQKGGRFYKGRQHKSNQQITTGKQVGSCRDPACLNCCQYPGKGDDIFGISGNVAFA